MQKISLSQPFPSLNDDFDYNRSQSFSKPTQKLVNSIASSLQSLQTILSQINIQNKKIAQSPFSLPDFSLQMSSDIFQSFMKIIQPIENLSRKVIDDNFKSLMNFFWINILIL